MFVSRSCLTLAVLAGLIGSFSETATTLAGPMPPARRTAGILVADTTLDAVYLCRDLNGNGNAMDPGEATVYFDATNASGLGVPTGSVFALFQSCDGTVYVADGGSDTVYACLDRNADGDANDAGEARVWFSSFNQSLITLPTPNGVCEGADGAIYITNAGAGSSPLDGLYRTVDLNGDGDAEDAGESSVFVDETALALGNTSPFGCSLLGGTVCFLDLMGSAPNTIYAARDTNGDGSVSATELGVFFVEGGVVPAPASFTCASDGTSLYTHASLSSSTQTVWRLTDANASGAIDQPGEGVAIWSESSLPAGATMANSFDFTLGPAMLAIASNGTGLNNEVIVARDINGDGDYNDAGGTNVFVQNAPGSGLPVNARAVLFYGPPCLADINNSCSVSVQDIFDFLSYYFSGSIRADINNSGGVSVQDIFDYLALYFTGC